MPSVLTNFIFPYSWNLKQKTLPQFYQYEFTQLCQDIFSGKKLTGKYLIENHQTNNLSEKENKLTRNKDETEFGL